MVAFILRRTLALFVVLLGMTAVMFVATHLLPADPAAIAAGPGAGPAQIAIVRHQMHLDEPLLVQYLTYLSGLIHLDLGRSIITDQPITQELWQALPVTLELVGLSTVCIVVICIPGGILAAASRSSWVDAAIRIASLAGTAIAPFWLAIGLQYIFYAQLGWLPGSGQLSLTDTPPPHVTGAALFDTLVTAHWSTLLSSIKHLIMPVVALTLGQLGILLRIVRVQVRGELGKDYVRSARAKGVSGTAVLRRHVLKNCLAPILTQLGIDSAYLLTGAVFVEAIFRLPGLGQYTVQAITNLDFPALTGVALVLSVLFVLINFLVDIAIVVTDPRVQL